MERVRVLVLTSSDSRNSASSKLVDGRVEYSGYPYLLWKHVQKALPDFHFVETHSAELDYDEAIEAVARDEYDLVVGHFFRNEERARKVTFLHPSTLDGIALVRKHDHGFLVQLSLKLLKYVTGLLVLGVLFGVLLHRADPTRNPDKPWRTILTSIAAFMGEMGFLAENPTLDRRGIASSVFVMIVAFIVFTVVQTHILSLILDERLVKSVPYHSFWHQSCLSPGGYYAARLVEDHVDITYVDGGVDATMKRYEESNDYFGCILTLTDALAFTGHYNVSTLDHTDAQHLLLSGWVVAPRHDTLARRLNEELIRAERSGAKTALCRAAFPNDNLTCFLSRA